MNDAQSFRFALFLNSFNKLILLNGVQTNFIIT